MACETSKYTGIVFIRILVIMRYTKDAGIAKLIQGLYPNYIQVNRVTNHAYATK